MRYKDMAVKGQKRQEMVLYLVVWAILFAAPLLSMYIDHHTTGLDYDFSQVISSWKLLAFFLCLFSLHNFLLAPLLVYGSRRLTYFSMVALLVVSFSMYQCLGRPHPVPPEMSGRPMEHRQHEPPRHEPHRHGGRIPPRPFGGEDMVQILVVTMLLGLNIGAKSYFKSLSDREKLKTLEHEHLEEQLQYLKYQINPHFFMNTLNNIHALVQFSPPQAQEAIEILSGLMRYVLYDADKPLAPLDKELAFVGNYMSIMRIRYVDVVSVETDLPERVPDGLMVPPLVFGTFLENAFKHGVSYEQESFIKLSITVSDKSVLFLCQNSRVAGRQENHSGVGLRNARRRLDILYGDSYSLDISKTDKAFQVSLRLPFKTNNNATK